MQFQANSVISANFVLNSRFLIENRIQGQSKRGVRSVIREEVKKIDFFLGNSPKQRTPPTYPYGLGLT